MASWRRGVVASWRRGVVALGLGRIGGTLRIAREWRRGSRVPMQPAHEVAGIRDANVRAIARRAAAEVPYYAAGRLGDVGLLDRSPCPCGWSSARVRLVGRSTEAIRLPGGRAVAPDAVARCVAGLEGIARFQLVERASRRFELRLRLVEGARVDGAASTAEQRARELLDGAEVSAVVDETLGPPAGGKFPTVVPLSRD